MGASFFGQAFRAGLSNILWLAFALGNGVTPQRFSNLGLGLSRGLQGRIVHATECLGRFAGAFEAGRAKLGVVRVDGRLIAPLDGELLRIAAAALGCHIPHVFCLAVEHGSIEPAAGLDGLLGQVLQAVGVFLATSAFRASAYLGTQGLAAALAVRQVAPGPLLCPVGASLRCQRPQADGIVKQAAHLLRICFVRLCVGSPQVCGHGAVGDDSAAFHGCRDRCGGDEGDRISGGGRDAGRRGHWRFRCLGSCPSAHSQAGDDDGEKKERKTYLALDDNHLSAIKIISVPWAWCPGCCPAWLQSGPSHRGRRCPTAMGPRN